MWYNCQWITLHHLPNDIVVKPTTGHNTICSIEKKPKSAIKWPRNDKYKIIQTRKLTSWFI